MIHIYLFLVTTFFNLHFGLTCYKGTRISLAQNNNTCNAGTGQQCIRAVLTTPTVLDNGTEIYTCGNCSQFQSPTFHNISCCNSGDLCQNLGVLPDSESCDAVTNQTGCVFRSDCYWCNNSLLGLGICKELSNFSAPCFAVSLYMPPPICESIACAQINPQYSSNKLSLQYLTNFGLPSIPYPTNIELALDLYSREVRTLSSNVTRNFCTLDSEFISWCGINSTTFPVFFKYCIISETWPHPDIYGWITNTTFTTNQGFETIFPAVCACLIPGRAYYIPTGFLLTQAYFSPSCYGEHTLLAFYILLMIMTTTVLFYVIYDVGILLLLTYQRNKKFSAGKTLGVKMCIICYFLITITDQGLWIAPQYTGVQNSVIGLFRLLGIIFFELSLALAIFTFCKLLLDTQAFGKKGNNFTKFLDIFKWLLLGSSIFILIATIVFAGMVAWYFQKFTSTDVSNISIFTIYQVNAIAVAKTVFYLLIALVFIIVVSSGSILVYTSYYIKISTLGSRNDSKQVRIVMYRNIFLLIAVISAFIWLGFIAVYCYMSLYVLGKIVQDPFISQYQGTIGLQWIIWGMFLSELITILLVALSMRTEIKSSWLFNYIVTTLNLSTLSKTVDNESVNSDV